ncbi:MAG: hypothetical protein VE99_C0003G0044 [candidate division Kazan bacterium GW2011_GWC1_52_13]|nr:MAG: hypothetical protein VE99_C0003G0044 [candidate division Kazan bacterium GW2011_GWC1_52_13]
MRLPTLIALILALIVLVAFESALDPILFRGLALVIFVLAGAYEIWQNNKK